MPDRRSRKVLRTRTQVAECFGTQAHLHFGGLIVDAEHEYRHLTVLVRVLVWMLLLKGIKKSSSDLLDHLLRLSISTFVLRHCGYVFRRHVGLGAFCQVIASVFARFSGQNLDANCAAYFLLAQQAARVPNRAAFC